MTDSWDGDLTGEVMCDRYVLGSMLGSGGMADVYRAYDRRLERAVAVKVFQGAVTPEDQIRLDREVQMLSGLSCRGIVKVFDTGTYRRRPYYVMQEIRGGTLRQRMQEPLAPALVARVGGQVADVLAYLHAHDVVHRDIKPSNILLEDDEKQAYLADFGLALHAHTTRITRSGLLVGTAGYLAPEQLRGTEVGTASDIYALGLVLLECLTGRPEYPGGDAEAALARLSRPPRIPPMLPAAWISLLAAMTDTDPARRPNAAQCAYSLKGAQEASRGLPALLPGIPDEDESMPGEPAIPKQRKVGLLLGGAAAAAAALAVALANIGGSTVPATGDPGPSSGAPVSSGPESIPLPPSTVTVIQQQPPAVVPAQPVEQTKAKKHDRPRPDRDRDGDRNAP